MNYATMPFSIAYGPLTSGAIYNAFVWTEVDYDYYYVDISSTGIFEAILSEDITGSVLLLAVSV